ncbi:109aa long hypothetical protein [Pyrococcus horikoshii OT3]|uniref:Uncharacterized protein n=1 Tax=Pyrococcus horikoshii (strain ATCC 700860 / DSM 12428 / JCM 9974 / NBRC 100139 / OT-3) TaxID=70601 RepID=O59478_PYRHO|nr:109aa long hypothetical protein [Pyrococcus horikoshii OT3]
MRTPTMKTIVGNISSLPTHMRVIRRIFISGGRRGEVIPTLNPTFPIADALSNKASANLAPILSIIYMVPKSKNAKYVIVKPNTSWISSSENSYSPTFLLMTAPFGSIAC